MKWLPVIFFLSEHEHEGIPYATEEECMAAAEDLVELNPYFEWVDGPRELGGETLLVIRSTVECIGADENPMLFERRQSQRGDK